jgi:integrase
MGVRLKKYFKQCKEISCTGKRNKACPETQKRQNGQYKTCSAWAVEFRTDGKWVSLIYSDVRSRSDAEKRLSLVITDRERGVLNLPNRKAVPTLGEYCKAYLELHKGDRENTRLGKERGVNALTSYLGEYRLDRKEKDGVKDSSINIDISVLSHVLNTAVKAGIIDKNPCREVKKLKVTQTKDRVLNSEEIALLLNKLRGKDRVMILTGLFTGMRLNEVIGLKWNDIDFQKGLITVT